MDALDFAIQAVLSQVQGKCKQLAIFKFRKLTGAELNYPIYEKELLTIVHAIKLWYPYLEGRKFMVVTDYVSLGNTVSGDIVTLASLFEVADMKALGVKFLEAPSEKHVLPNISVCFQKQLSWNQDGIIIEQWL